MLVESKLDRNKLTHCEREKRTPQKAASREMEIISQKRRQQKAYPKELNCFKNISDNFTLK